jgi:hypothetical protein
MPRTCSVCRNPKLNEINTALLENESYRNIAKRFEASASAVFRHQQEHLPAALLKAKDATEVAQADSLMDKITHLEQEARRLGKKAEDAGDLRGAMGAIHELLRIVELLAKMQKDHPPSKPVEDYDVADWEAAMLRYCQKWNLPLETLKAAALSELDGAPADQEKLN